MGFRYDRSSSRLESRSEPSIMSGLENRLRDARFLEMQHPASGNE